MAVAHDNFPLATGLAKLVDPQVDALVEGREPEFLDEVTPLTAELLRFWFQQDYCDTRFLNFHVGQRAAILNVIYAHEVLKARTLRDLYHAVAGDGLLESGYLGEVSRERNKHPKYCAKMATGTGKTWVLNALLIWQHLNHHAYPDDERFTSNFLLVAPGLIVYDRLLDSFQGKFKDGERDFETSDIFQQQNLFVPDNYRDQVFGFLKSSVVTKHDIGKKVTGAGIIAITNWHLLAGEEDPDFLGDEDEIEAPGEDIDPKAVVESIFPVTPGTTAGNTLDSLDRKFMRGGPLQALKDLPSLVVFNDEAHHIHSVRRADEVTDVEWQRALLEIAANKGSQFVQIDFSATPFNEVGSGRKARREWFPHIIVNFDLNAAMRRGLVKALALDKRKEIASLPLDFRAERDERGKVIGLSEGQRTMLRAGLKKLQILEEKFTDQAADKHPKMMVICEDTAVSPFVEEFLSEAGMPSDSVLRVDSGKRAELSAKQWEPIKETLFGVDKRADPKVIISVLMLREGFDVNNICVIVPLRSSEASILLEQTVGRGLRLMWRGDDAIDELKRETRERIANHQEPTNYYDVLFIVEHPAFSAFYDDLLSAGLAVDVDDASDSTDVTGDLENIDLREGYEAYDFEIPIIIRDAEEEMRRPSIDPMTLPVSKYQLDWLIRQIGTGDRFVSQDAQTGTQYGDYRVDGGVMTATGYNEYLSRMTTRISEALGRTFTKSAKTYSEISQYPVLQAYKPLLASWLDTYIKHRFFGKEFDPFEAENWRVLLLAEVPGEIAGHFATKLVEVQQNQEVGGAIVKYRRLSEAKTISVRQSAGVDVKKCIYPRLRVPSKGGGLERLFIEWADRDTHIEALAKIDEYKHEYLHRPYLKVDGMPALYSPDFLIRTDMDVYIVETKGQGMLSDENVLRKKRAALAWCKQINDLPEDKRDGRDWHYVLLGEQAVKEWESKGTRASELLDHARIRDRKESGQQTLI